MDARTSWCLGLANGARIHGTWSFEGWSRRTSCWLGLTYAKSQMAGQVGQAVAEDGRELRQKYQMEIQNLTLTTQPFKTLQFFVFALVEYLKQLLLFVFWKGGWLVLFSIFLGILGLVLLAVDGSQEHLQEFRNYFRYAFWWVALGVASSIGLGEFGCTDSFSFSFSIQ
ncbi:hypothetical protein MA16_Dca011720 [Dendrobium catenatum]|uniref:Uncharacterized protein n=1 Tax=Dendrobium catenatum TaxID=906689 RepID=A0A2I0WY71_9ASPA|nr:hypothetical protein MA16_Dca011720 [Dendrobium catenatum]